MKPEISLSVYEEAVQAAVTELNAKADLLQRQGQLLLRQAGDLRERARGLTGNPSAEGVLRNWRGIDRATAFRQCMMDIPIGHRVHVADVVKALRDGGCDLTPKLRLRTSTVPSYAENALEASAR